MRWQMEQPVKLDLYRHALQGKTMDTAKTIKELRENKTLHIKLKGNKIGVYCCFEE